VGGVLGSVLTAVFADPAISGVPANMLSQVTAVAAVAAYSAVGTAVLLGLVRLVVPLRVGEQAEQQGLDLSTHMERQH
jgi:Amt family ammonium transporter